MKTTCSWSRERDQLKCTGPDRERIINRVITYVASLLQLVVASDVRIAVLESSAVASPVASAPQA